METEHVGKEIGGERLYGTIKFPCGRFVASLSRENANISRGSVAYAVKED